MFKVYFGNRTAVAPIPPVDVDRSAGGSSSARQRRKFRYITKAQLEELLFSKEEEPPPPTPGRVRTIQREIVEEVAGGLLGPEREQIARFVKREIVRAYKPAMDWGELARAFEQIARKAAEEAEEIEDEEFILMFA